MSLSDVVFGSTNHYWILLSTISCVILTLLPRSSNALMTNSSSANITITVPPGTTNHGNAHLLCTPSSWTDVVTFFFANFFAHAATLKSLPGEPAIPASWALVFALMIPTSGIVRGLKAIYQRAILCDTPLETAAKAEALCMVIRTASWRPRTGDVIRGASFSVPKVVPEENGERASISYRLRQFWMRAKDRELDGVVLQMLKPELDGQASNVKSILRSVMDRGSTQDSSNKAEAQKPLSLAVHHWSPLDSPFLPSIDFSSIQGRSVHGICCLPPGYALLSLPSEAVVVGLGGGATCQQVGKTHGWFRRSISSFRINIVGFYSYLFKRHSTGRLERLETGLGSYISNGISSSYNLPKALVAIFQTVYASATLYSARGDQIEQYGFAAFGLTVAPYLVMSLVNLVSGILTPDYATVYLVKSEIMEEAMRREGAIFEGMVGSIVADGLEFNSLNIVSEVEDGRIQMVPSRAPTLTKREGQLPKEPEPEAIEVSLRDQKLEKQQSIHSPTLLVPSYPKLKKTSDIQSGTILLASCYGSLLIGCLAIAINGSLSHFQHSQSTYAQRVWTMTWLGFGIMIGPLTLLRDKLDVDYLVSSIYFIPAIGGFVAVARMLLAYGNCVKID